MRNLTAGEIVSQVIQAKRALNDFPTVEDLDMRRRYIQEKRKRMRQHFAEYYRSQRPHAHSTPPRPKVEEPQENAPEEDQRAITNIVFMVFLPLAPMYSVTNCIGTLPYRVKVNLSTTTKMYDKLYIFYHMAKDLVLASLRLQFQQAASYPTCTS